MAEHSIDSMIEAAMSKIKEISSSQTVIGEPVVLPNGVTAIPVCKVSVGFGAGGADLVRRENAFGGGTGAGLSVTPIAFLVTTKDSVKLIQLDTIGTTADNIVRAVPDVLDRVSSIVSDVKKGKNE
jgi:sporulation protein YtfJ